MKSYRIIIILLIIFVIYACQKDDIANDPDPIVVVADSVKSMLRWNDMNVTVDSGVPYTFHSIGEWIDLNIITNADGFTDSFLDQFSSLKRIPAANWFELIASVDTTSFYIVGKDTTLTFEESGNLFLFANDAEGFYGNNSGSIFTEITR